MNTDRSLPATFPSSLHGSLGEGLAFDPADAPSQPFPTTAFGDVLAANARFAKDFRFQGLSGHAARGLAVITCMDSRIDPLKVLGMEPGDVKILRNAGARVTDDVLRTLILACYLLGVDRVLVMPHTKCRMVGTPEADVHHELQERHGVDTRGIHFGMVSRIEDVLHDDLERIRQSRFLPQRLVVAGGVYDVDTGQLTPVSA